MRERMITIGDVEIATEAFGDPANPPLLLLMGATASMLWWPLPLVESLAAGGRHVIRYDLRDTGRSTTYPHGTPPYDLDDLADDAVAVLDAYGLQSAHFVGMSLGGLLAQIVALKHKQRLRSLTLVSSQIFGPPGFDDPEIPEGLMQHFIAGHALDWSDEAAVVAHTVDTWRLTSGPGRPFDADLIRAVATEDYRRARDPQAALNHQALAGGEAWYGRTTEIAAPLLVIHGTDDPVIPIGHGHALRQAVPGTRLLALEGAGHELHASDWPVIAEAVLSHTAE